MDVSSLLVGIAVLLVVGILETRNRSVSAEQLESDTDRDYFYRRGRRRRLVHVILGIVGILAIAAGGVGRGDAYVLIWAAVPLLILIAVLLAMADGYRTVQYHDQKLPEVREATLASVEALTGDPSDSADANET